MTRSLRTAAVGLVMTCSSLPSRGGEFDRIDGDSLARVARPDAAKRRTSLTLKQLDALSPVLKDSQSPLLVVRTGQGNFAAILASPALRKPPGGDGAAVPVLVLDRFATFEPGRSGSRLARGEGVLLFDGFQIDLDGGLIVPAGQGGDLEFTIRDGEGPTLKAVGPSTIFTPAASPATAPASAGPSPDGAVLPGDFAGRFTLHADGRWSGLLEIQVAADRQITGRFRSEPNGGSYAVTGEVAAGTPPKAVFTVRFPRTEQVYAAHLWTRGKNVMTGSFTMLERTYGFVAVREGSPSPLGP